MHSSEYNSFVVAWAFSFVSDFFNEQEEKELIYCVSFFLFF